VIASARRRLQDAGARVLAEDGRPLLWILAALILLHAVVLVRTAWICDDAFITLRSVDNFVHGHGLRWNVTERVQTFTHPLWLLVVTPLYAATEHPFAALLLPAMAASLAALALLAFGAGQRPRSAAVALVAAIASRALVDYSTSGLENPLTHLLLVGMIVLVADDRPGTPRLLLVGLLAGLCVLNRMDTVLLVAPPLAWLAWSSPRPRRLAALAVGFAPFLAWEALATLYYGSPLPNTAPAKLGTGVPAGELAVQGLSYLAHSARHDPVTLGALVLGLVFALWRPDPWRVAWALGVAAYLAYVVKIGGDFMAGRMLTVPLVVSLTWLARSKGPPVRGRRGIARVVVLLLAAATPRPPWLSGAHYGADRRDLISARGISDERRYYFPVSGWLSASASGSRPTPSSPARLKGSAARKIRAPLLVEGAVGFVGFYAGPDVHIVDYHGLCDPLLARMPAVRESGEADAAPGWRIGHFERVVPPGYLSTLLTGNNRLSDPALAELYEDVRLRTRAALLAPGRLGAILRGLFGGRRSHRVSSDSQPVPWEEVLALRPQDSIARYELARRQRAAGQLPHARRQIAAALQRAPELVPARIEAAEIASRQGDPLLAGRHLRQALLTAPEHGEIHYRLGESLLRRGHPAEAIDAFRSALQWDPGLASAYANVGLCYARMGVHREALRWLVDALHRIDEPAGVYQNLAGVLLELGRPRRAAEALEHAARAHDEAGRPGAAERMRARRRSVLDGVR
jgi:arabinofuranosyltransferase